MGGYPIPIYSTQQMIGLALPMLNLCIRELKAIWKQVINKDHANCKNKTKQNKKSDQDAKIKQQAN